MPKEESSPMDTGVAAPSSKASAATTASGNAVQLFGHVTFVEGYALPQFLGCHALVKLRDTPNKIVAVLTTQHNLQTLLETALATGNLIAFRGRKAINPPTPQGGTWSVEVYLIDNINLYNMK